MPLDFTVARSRSPRYLLTVNLIFIHTHTHTHAICMFSKMSRYRDREGSSDLLDTHYTRGKQYISITPTAVRNMFHFPLGGQRWFPIVPCLSLAPSLLSCHFPHFYFFLLCMEIPNSYIVYGTRKYFQNLRVICKQIERFVVLVVVLFVVAYLEVHSLLSQKQSVETTLGFFYDNYGNLHYALPQPDTTNG